MRYLLLFFTFISLSTSAAIDWSTIEDNLASVGGHRKALSHMKCFLRNYYGKEISLKEPDSTSNNDRCYAKEALSLQDVETLVLIDYTLPGTKRRLFLINTRTNEVKPMGVAHGRYNSGYVRFFTRHNKNSLKWAKYYSNEPGSNAPSSGFFFAGQTYVGKFGESLILHGLEPGVNDYACERAVVIHKNWAVSKKRAYAMSSGCPMVSPKYIDEILERAKGSQNGIQIESAGSLVFIYGPREKAWDQGQCTI